MRKLKVRQGTNENIVFRDSRQDLATQSPVYMLSGLAKMSNYNSFPDRHLTVSVWQRAVTNTQLAMVLGRRPSLQRWVSREAVMNAQV